MSLIQSKFIGIFFLIDLYSAFLSLTMVIYIPENETKVS